MRVRIQNTRRARIEMLPLIDIVFLLLVFFIYAMLSMAVHRGLPVILPTSSTAKVDRRLPISVTVQSDGTVYLDRQRVPPGRLAELLRSRSTQQKGAGVLLFADKSLPYQKLFHVLDEIRTAGLSRVSLQAQAEQ